MRLTYRVYSLSRGVYKVKTKTAIAISAFGLVVGGGGGLAMTMFGTAHAAPDTLYVSTSGSDTGDCTSSPCATIDYALSQVTTSGTTISVAAGTYDAGFTVNNQSDVTISGAGAGSTIIKPTTLVDTGVAHKYTSDMMVSAFVNHSSDVTISDMTIKDNGSAPGAGGPDTLVFWNASTGSLQDSNVTASYTINGDQTGQGIALDASGSENASLDVDNVNISGFQKNGIDALNGNGATSGSTGGLTLNVLGGSITGAGPTSTIAQNGIVLWNRGGGTVTGTVDGAKISKFEYTSSGDYATGILAYGGGELTSVKNASFADCDYYLASVAGSGTIDATHGNTFDFVSPDNASVTQLGAIENRLIDAMHAQDTPPHDNGAIYIKPNSAIVTPNTLGIQTAVDLVGSNGKVYVAPGTYTGNVTINPPVTLIGNNAGVKGTSYLRAPESVIDGIVTINDPSVTLNGFTVDGTNSSAYGVEVNSTGDNAVITNNIIKDLNGGSGDAQGVYLENGPDGVKVTRNAIYDIQGGQSTKGVFIGDSTSTDPSDNVQVSDNAIYNITSGEKGAYGLLINNGSSPVGTTANNGLVIQDNTFRSLTATAAGGWVHAIGLEANTPGAVVNHNTIEGLVGSSADKVGVWLERENTSHASVKVNQNNFLYANAYGIAVDPTFTSGTLDGTCNYWGSKSGPSGVGPGTGASVTPLVKYSPWLQSENGDCTNHVEQHKDNDNGKGHHQRWYEFW